MNRADPVCPARVYGRVAECRWCIWLPGGAPSALCLKMWTSWDKEEQKKKERENAVDITRDNRGEP